MANDVLSPARTASDTGLPRDVLLLSTADWNNPFWTNKQHVAQKLARRGFRVLYVESLGLRAPTVSARDARRIARRLARAARPLRRVEENLWVFSPLALPWHSQPLARALNHKLLSGMLRGALGWLGFRRPIVWTYNPLISPLVEQVDYSLLVYHCVDDLTAAPHMPAATIEQAEQDLANRADLLFATSPALAEKLRRRRPTETYYFPNVADFEHFSQARSPGELPADLAAIPQPRLGFVGALSDYKVDFALIATIARARPDWHWALIGQIGEGQPDTRLGELRTLPNVHLLGPRSYADLPNYLRGFDVATIPCVRNGYTAAMFPMKFFEYLSAGLPVVASNAPAIEAYAEACRLTLDAATFEAAVVDVLAGRGPDAQIADQLARRFTWDWRMNEMLACLEGAWAKRQGLPVKVSAARAA
jgi:glycosyltransferase involved in cell wall biosynthesis